MADQGGSELLRTTLARLAPGTDLREGLERILRGRTGALVVLGHNPVVEALCDGGFALDVQFAPTRLRELSKMDGAVVLDDYATRILRANVQLVPDPSIPTDESGTRHRTAERVAIQTGYPVVSVSQSMGIVSVYVDGTRHVLADSSTILSRANQAVDTLERYKTRLDEVDRQLSVLEIEDFVTQRDAMTVVQRLQMVRRISSEIADDVVELGTDGRLLQLQLEELMGGTENDRLQVVRDYLPGHPGAAEVAELLDVLDTLGNAELLDLTRLSGVFGLPAAVESLDAPLSPRGYRLLSRVPRLPEYLLDSLVDTFGSLQSLLAATAEDLRRVDGVGEGRARSIREGLSRLAEASIAERYQ
ncbi:DNA integrity scanning diadenylate cyclase DisA [Rhodococcus aerolatus]